MRASAAGAAALLSLRFVALALPCEDVGAALCARAQGALASKLIATADRVRKYAARVTRRNKSVIGFLIEASLNPERRLRTDRGQNVAGQLKSCCKSPTPPPFRRRPSPKPPPPPPPT